MDLIACKPSQVHPDLSKQSDSHASQCASSAFINTP